MHNKTIYFQDNREQPLVIYSDGRVYRPDYVDKRDRLIKGRFISFKGRQQKRPVAVGTVYNSTALHHRLVAQAFLPEYKPNLHVDHIDGNPENNCPSNLRMVTQAFNNRAHKEPYRKGKTTSRYRGVSWMKNRGKWRAAITHKYKQIHIGLFDSEEDAKLAYNKKVKELSLPDEALNN